ncbi:hypothetical protein HYS94_00855 [Candidatus Daviesbacteria bacterium]|nr:hypothetical protein [Candidatus Daviesbacteria bacterium]
MPKPTITDDQKHEDAQKADEELQDESSPLGHASEETEDIDETLKSVGLPNDDQGPKELNSQEVIDKADKNQE